MAGAGVLGFVIAIFSVARVVAEGQGNGAHHQDAGEEERERCFHALAVGGGSENSHAEIYPRVMTISCLGILSSIDIPTPRC
jgi:hypothetical protein